MTVELRVLRRRQQEHAQDDQPEDGQDHQGGDEHALPVAVVAAVGNQLLQQDKKVTVRVVRKVVFYYTNT